MSQEIIEFKVIIVGEPGVGKTSILKKIDGQNYDEMQTPTLAPSSYNIEFKSKNLENVKMFLDIWDTAGQERYRSLQKCYYKDVEAAILVYDITNSKSYNELVNFWIKEIYDYCGDSIG